MPKFRPDIFLPCDEHKLSCYDERRWKNGHLHKSYPTYRELKKDLPFYLGISHTGEVFVTRYRRGEWGEYFEVWRLVNGKPKIIREGWQ